MALGRSVIWVAGLSLLLTVTGCVAPSDKLLKSHDTYASHNLIRFWTEEMTAPGLDVSPDGQTLVFDVLGDLYTASLNGGDAQPLLRNQSYDYGPRFSPDGQRIAFLSDRSGTFTFWSVAVDGSDAREESKIEVDAGSLPKWGANGVEVEDAGVERLSPNKQWAAQVQALPQGGSELRLRSLASGEQHSLPLPPMTDRTFSNLTRFAFTADSTGILCGCDGKIKRLDIASGESRVVPIRVPVEQRVDPPVRADRRVEENDQVQSRVIRWPTLSADGQHLAFSAFAKIFVADVPSGKSRRLTAATEAEYGAAYSPDGQWIAYTSWSDADQGNVMVVSAQGGTPRRVTTDPGRFASPTWSPDGKKLVFIANTNFQTDPKGRLDDELLDQPLELRWVPVEGGASQLLSPIGRLFQPGRFYQPLSFDAKGERVFYPAQSDDPSDDMVSIFSAAFDGKPHREEFRISRNVDEVLMSPDGRYVAAAGDDNVAVAPVPVRGAGKIPVLSFNGARSEFVVLQRRGGQFLAWKDASTLTWSVTNDIYIHRVNPNLAVPSVQKLLDVQVSLPRPKAQGQLAFVNARIITMRGAEVIERGTLLVDGSRIVAVGRKLNIPAEARIVDLAGATIIPGLIDVHDHINRRRRELFPQQKWEYLADLAYGVTTSYDPSVWNADVFGMAEMVEAGVLIGPRIYASGDMIFGEVPNFPVFRAISSQQEANDAVNAVAQFKPSLIKDYAQPRRDKRRWLVAAARAAHVPITGESRGRVKLLTQVVDGYTAIEHDMGTRPVFDDVARFIGASGVHYTPTLIVSGEYESCLGGTEDIDGNRVLHHFTPAWFLAKFDRLRREYNAKTGERCIDSARQMLRLEKAGVRLSIGAHGQLPGLGTHWEIWAFKFGGTDELKALRAGTLHGAQKLGLDRDLGSLEPGKLADFIVLEGNPLEDIRNTAKIRYVIKGGFVYDSPTLTRLWPTRQRAPVASWHAMRDRARYQVPVADDLPVLPSTSKRLK